MFCIMRKALLLLKKIWNFLIHEDSWTSFLADAIIILIVGKFIFFPLLGFMLGTSFPAVAVVSTSMDHQNQEFDAWWENNAAQYKTWNLSKEEFEKFYLKDGFKQGDVLVIKGKSMQELAVGDIIVFSVDSRNDPIIHRIVKVDKTSFETKGDANSGQLGFEKSIAKEQIHGKAIFKIPKIGWVKVGFLKLIGKL